MAEKEHLVDHGRAVRELVHEDVVGWPAVPAQRAQHLLYHPALHVAVLGHHVEGVGEGDAARVEAAKEDRDEVVHERARVGRDPVLLVRVEHVPKHVLVLVPALAQPRRPALRDDVGQRAADGGGALGVLAVGGGGVAVEPAAGVQRLLELADHRLLQHPLKRHRNRGGLQRRAAREVVAEGGLANDVEGDALHQRPEIADFSVLGAQCFDEYARHISDIHHHFLQKLPVECPGHNLSHNFPFILHKLNQSTAAKKHIHMLCD